MIETFRRYQYADVGLTCLCGGKHGQHYEVRVDNHHSADGCDHCDCNRLEWTPAQRAPEPELIFSKYRRLLAEEATKPPTEWTFKSNPSYTQFLEHVTLQQGMEYLCLLEQFSEWGVLARTLIAEAALANDRLGQPIRERFDALGANCSPTNLRYAWQAFTLWRHVATDLDLVSPHLIEIGGGYGGLALYVHRLARLFTARAASYTIVDVPEAGPIQQAFLNDLNVPVRTVDGTDRQSLDRAIDATRNGPRVLISAYGFSELSASLRAWYEETITQHCPHGFLVWNRSGVYPLAEAPARTYAEPVMTEVGTRVVLY